MKTADEIRKFIEKEILNRGRCGRNSDHRQSCLYLKRTQGLGEIVTFCDTVYKCIVIICNKKLFDIF